MALFSKKKTSTTKTGKVVASTAKSAEAITGADILSKRPVLQGPSITEKAVRDNDKGLYVFNVDVRATKSEIKQAVKRLYNVDAIDVRVLNHPGKQKRRGNKLGRTVRSRRAYVQLGAGQSIELV